MHTTQLIFAYEKHSGYCQK